MAYKIMKVLISNKNRTAEGLQNMADVYYAAGRLTEEEYTEIIGMIKEKTDE